MNRRRALGTLATGGLTLLAGCSGQNIEGEVLASEVPLALTHDHSTQSTFSGTRVVVDVTAENDGEKRLTPEKPVPRIVCTFLDGSGGTLYESGLQLPETIDPGGTVALEFALAVDVDDLSRYTLRSEWVED
jgi:hypothetical protein